MFGEQGMQDRQAFQGPVAVVFGTRPEAIKLSPLVHALRARNIPVSVIVTAQHREILDQVLALFDIQPDHDLNVMTANQTLEALTVRLLTGLGEVFRAISPSLVIVQGDTTTAMTAALAAFYQKIPIGHVEAGLRSGDLMAPWPEEANRKIVSAICNLHFAPTETAGAALLAENIASKAVFVTGNTVIDALHIVRDKLNSGAVVAERAQEILAGTGGKRIILVTCHRRENFGDGVGQIAEALLKIAARGDVEIILPVHPNPNVRDLFREKLAGQAGISLVEPLDYLNFVQIFAHSTLVLTDSGGLQEEAPALGKPALVMRNTTERPEGITAGTARLVGVKTETIVSAVFDLLDNETSYRAMANAHNPFGDGTACAQISEIVRSFQS
jgi:UDP-N-acetylglucosamine 2-epimerase (non-hydrolysing)